MHGACFFGLSTIGYSDPSEVCAVDVILCYFSGWEREFILLMSVMYYYYT